MGKTKVLVTGADGFIGSHLTEALLSAGYQVRALSYYNSFNDWGWLEGINNPDLEVVSGDVRDPDFCRHITRGCSLVFHLAALIAIPYSYVAPDSYVDTNIRGRLNMLQAARDCNVERIVVTSTSEVYGTALYVPIDENHPRQPQSPYSATKIGADALAKSFYNAFELPVVIARPFNTYGPAPERTRHNSDHHYPDCGRTSRDQSGRSDADPRLQLCHRHCRRIHSPCDSPGNRRPRDKHRHRTRGDHGGNASHHCTPYGR